jgi:hypothetical protein
VHSPKNDRQGHAVGSISNCAQHEQRRFPVCMALELNLRQALRWGLFLCMRWTALPIVRSMSIGISECLREATIRHALCVIFRLCLALEVGVLSVHSPKIDRQPCHRRQPRHDVSGTFTIVRSMFRVFVARVLIVSRVVSVTSGNAVGSISASLHHKYGISQCTHPCRR